MNSIQRLFENHNFLMVDPKAISYDALYDMIEDNYIIRETEISYRILRSFDLEDLRNDINCQVYEQIYIACSYGTEEFDDEDIKEIRSLGLFSFDRDGMRILHEDKCALSYSVTSEKKMKAYIIDNFNTDDIHMSLRSQMDMDIDDVKLNNIIEYLEEKGIQPWKASDEQIMDAMKNEQSDPNNGYKTSSE